MTGGLLLSGREERPAVEQHQIQVLLIEDNPGDARLIREALGEIKGNRFNLEWVNRLGKGLERLGRGGIDVVLLDLKLPDALGLDTYFQVHRAAPEVPVVVLSGNADETLAMTAVQEGAQDYLVKGQASGKHVERALRYAIERGLYRRRFKTLLQQELSLQERAPSPKLAVLYQLSRMLNSTSSLPELLDQTLTLIFQEIKAERAMVFLYNAAGELEPTLTRSRHPGQDPEPTATRTILQRAIAEHSALICADADAAGSAPPAAEPSVRIPSALAVPLWDVDQTLGGLYLDNPCEGSVFGPSDLELVSAIANLVALAVKREKLAGEARGSEALRTLLERFHSPDVASLILSQARQGDGFSKFLLEREVTVLFSDICNFTRWLEHMDPAQAADLVNEYFEEMTSVIFKYRGTVDKFLGDGIMAIYGAPISHGNDAELAIFSAIEMIRKNEEFQAQRPPGKRFEIRVGINTGVVMAGYLGSKRRIEYTVLGDPVNVAARLPYLAPPHSILVGEETYSQTQNIFTFRDRGSTRLKGKKSETHLYEVIF